MLSVVTVEVDHCSFRALRKETATFCGPRHTQMARVSEVAGEDLTLLSCSCIQQKQQRRLETALMFLQKTSSTLAMALGSYYRGCSASAEI